ncbi:uncharacterized protein N7483_005537 [Penicillium malachiteum]|uniref:uncharacterized protein n=1 Tax=Penicillium malachiteum TaxID=1324776 RepID=UPI002547F190|nr:uncharacterized protein N7483_005537 [Penicillium malachiteum]KAJ5731029.1 hypothetical protein N7483_005537 [Penicillium malachiteum]
MARTDSQYGREPRVPSAKGRISTDSMKSWSKKDTGSKTKLTKDRSWVAEDPGLVPSRPLGNDFHEPVPFPEYSDIQTPGSKDRDADSIRNLPNMTPSDPWSPTPNESSDALDYRSKSKQMKPKVHIKPMLRKMSRDDAPTASIDLSRSSTEQEGLGIYMNMERDRRRSDFQPEQGRAEEDRDRNTFILCAQPPKYTPPPLSESYHNSGNESDELEDDGLESDPRALSTETNRYVRASSGPVPRASLQIEDESFTRLPGASQTNISGRPSFGYSRDNGSTYEHNSIGRNSLDIVFRSRTRNSTDPITRAATVQAARQAFEEKEAAKTRRIEKQQLKAEERQSRRHLKRQASEGPEIPTLHSTEEISEKPKPPGAKPAASGQQNQSASWKSQSKSTWVLFMTWLRTRVFKFRRKLRKMT